jgi:hypothetical protein
MARLIHFAASVAARSRRPAPTLKTTGDVTTVDGGNIAAALRWREQTNTPSSESEQQTRRHPEVPAEGGPRRMAAGSVLASTLRGSALRASHLRVTPVFVPYCRTRATR